MNIGSERHIPGAACMAASARALKGIRARIYDQEEISAAYVHNNLK